MISDIFIFHVIVGLVLSCMEFVDISMSDMFVSLCVEVFISYYYLARVLICLVLAFFLFLALVHSTGLTLFSGEILTTSFPEKSRSGVLR